MDEKSIVDRLNKLLPEMNQQEKLDAILQITGELLEEDGSDVEVEFLNTYAELDDDSNRISVIQSLANNLEK